MQSLPWHRADIVAAIWKKGTSLRAMSLAAGYGASTLRASLERLHPQAHDIIAAKIGVPRQMIWPQFYGPDGSRRRLRPERSSRQIRRAA
jgi:Ner family transcriptional regulator